ncbi:hypothetical protein CMI48_00825 [Candidatus Pacearchaeota archaeon]|jgi:hypothetical protein|nr:hypothetical protein [Candidatus Pacearchaeota archaeon]
MAIHDKKRGLGIFFATVVLLSVSFVVATHVVTLADGTLIDDSAIEDNRTNFTISVNATENIDGGNITEVNITLPAGVTFVAGSNDSSLNASSNFNQTGQVLSWSNGTENLIANGTVHNFTFEATVAEPGNYQPNVSTINGSFDVDTTLIVLEINDSSLPTVEYDGATLTDGDNHSVSAIAVNITFTDNFNVTGARAELFNATGDLVNISSVSNATGNLTDRDFFINFTGHADGNYVFNATVNDSDANSNSTLVTRNVTIDTTAPVIALAESTDTSASQIVIDIAITESGSGINSTCTVDASGNMIAGTDATQTLTDVDATLSCGKNKTYTITCLDNAGNTASTAASSFGTTSCSTSSSSGGGGGGGGGSSGTPLADSDTEVDSGDGDGPGLSPPSSGGPDAEVGLAGSGSTAGAASGSSRGIGRSGTIVIVIVVLVVLGVLLKMFAVGKK